MNSKVIECPICFKNYSACNIEKHVQNCGVVSFQDKDRNLKRKSEANKSSKGNSKKVAFLTDFDSKEQHLDSASSSTTLDPSLIEASTAENNSLKPKLESSEWSKICFTKPLYDMARPTKLNEYVGQTEVVGKDTVLHKLLEDNIVPSMIFWGPPGCGKTTLAHIIANNVKYPKDVSKVKIQFVKLSATDSGKADLQAAIKVASNKQRMFNCKTILFIDEIHRFNKLQQDSLLPPVENGTIILIGATTENPSFALNSALLSRCKVIVLKKLEIEHVKSLLLKTISSFLPLVEVVSSQTDDYICMKNDQIYVKQSAIDLLANLCDGDARNALNGLQIAVETVQISNEEKKIITPEVVQQCLQRSHYLYDRKGI